MEGSQFDDFIRTLAASRRSLLGGTLGLASGLIGLSTIDARKKRKRKKPGQASRTPQATPNEFGCLNMDASCTSPEQCCSGICEGTRGRRTCRAHDVGDCQAGFALESEIPCSTSGGEGGLCGTTTGNAGYCLITGDCYPCKTDLECQRADGGFFGPTAACVRFAGCGQTGGTVCALARL